MSQVLRQLRKLPQWRNLNLQNVKGHFNKKKIKKYKILLLIYVIHILEHALLEYVY